MKVLYVSKALAVAAYRDKIDALGRHVDCEAIVPDRWRGGLEAPVDRPRLHREPVRFAGRNHVHWYRRPSSWFRRFAPDLLHIDEEPYSLVTTQLVRQARAHRVPAVFFAWQNMYKRLPPPFGWLRRYVVRHARGAIAGTPQAAEVLHRAGCDAPIAVIPQFGVSERRFAPDPAARRRVRVGLGWSTDEPVVGFAGRLVPEKGVAQLLPAIQRLASVKLLVIGDGPERARLERTVRALDLAGRVRIVRRVASLDMPAWLNALDVLVLPSRRTRRWTEQFGRVLVEAMACGVPVVASDSGEIPRVVGDAGVLVPEGDTRALGAALHGLLHDAARRAALADRGRERVSACYTNDRVAQRTARFYRELLDGSDSVP